MHGPRLPRRASGRGVPASMLHAAAGVLSLSACTGGDAGTGPWLFGTVALLVAGIASYAAGNLHARRTRDTAARAARRDLHDLAALIDDGSWQTDAEHRLLRLQSPRAADAAARGWAIGRPLWESFGASSDGAAALRQRLQSQAPFSDLRLPAHDAALPDWLLRATPRIDDDGGFAGYIGTARPAAQTPTQRIEQAALQALLAALATLEVPSLLAVADDGAPGGWRLRHANAAAGRLFDADLPTWPALLEQLPQSLREALAQPGDDAERDGWLLRRFAVDDAKALLLLKAVQPEADAGNGEGASFSFTLSHDLRAPIRVVEGFTRILKEDYGRQLDRVGNDHLDRVLGAAARMNHMIDALLALAKLSQQPLARQPVNLSQLAGYVVDDLRRSTPERAAEIEIEPGMAAQGDPTLLRLVLENLLGNAWKYTARCTKTNIVFASTVHEGRRTYVVRDNGAGFDMRSADRLFGLFQRLHSANDFPGTGVGLASVKRIIRRHGGDVWADAEPGRGAAFHFTLRD